MREAALEFWQVFAGTGRVVDDAPVRVLPRKRFVRRLEIIGEALSRGDSWLSSEQNFLKIKRMFAEGMITGVWGSVASPEAFSPLTRELKKEGALVSLVYTSNINSQNQLQGNAGDVVVVPEWTDVNDWAAVCDPAVAPAIYIGERFGILPEIFIAGDNLSPAVFMNDETRLKVRQFAAVWVNDFRPLANNHV